MAQVGQQGLRLEIIWNGEAMVEVQAFASNGRYCGATEVYTTTEELLELADGLAGFPKKVTDVVKFEAGEKGGYSFLGLKFFCIDGAGHTAVCVEMEENTPTEYRPEEKHRVSFELQYEAGLIDQFHRGLQRMARSHTGFTNLF